MRRRTHLALVTAALALLVGAAPTLRAQEPTRGSGLAILASELRAICENTDWISASACAELAPMIPPPDAERWTIRPRLLALRSELKRRWNGSVQQNAFSILDGLSEAMLRSLPPQIPQDVRAQRDSVGSRVRVRVYDQRDSVHFVSVLAGDGVRATVDAQVTLRDTLPHLYVYRIAVQPDSPQGLRRILLPCGLDGREQARARVDDASVASDVWDRGCHYRVDLAPGESRELSVRAHETPGIEQALLSASSPPPTWPPNLNSADSIEAHWATDSLRGLQDRGLSRRVPTLFPKYEYDPTALSVPTELQSLRTEVRDLCAVPGLVTPELCAQLGESMLELTAAWQRARAARGEVDWTELRRTLSQLRQLLASAAPAALQPLARQALVALAEAASATLERRAAYR